jgi:5-methylcytosine-specific restriction endonuclease McrA
VILEIKQVSLRLPPNEYAELCLGVLKRDDWKCRSCGYRQTLACHHIIYRSELGPDESWNLVTLCAACHAGEHSGNLTIDVAEGNYVGPNGGADSGLTFVRAEGWKPE